MAPNGLDHLTDMHVHICTCKAAIWTCVITPDDAQMLDKISIFMYSSNVHRVYKYTKVFLT